MRLLTETEALTTKETGWWCGGGSDLALLTRHAVVNCLAADQYLRVTGRKLLEVLELYAKDITEGHAAESVGEQVLAIEAEWFSR